MPYPGQKSSDFQRNQARDQSYRASVGNQLRSFKNFITDAAVNTAAYNPLGLSNLAPVAPSRLNTAGLNRAREEAEQPAPQRPYTGPAPITTGTRDGVTPDRTQSDQYRAAMGQQAPSYPVFPLNQEGQFQRYFASGSPEMDRYFGGAASRGTGAPKDLDAMMDLASANVAPAGANPATYYRAQSAAGRGSMDSIITAMGYKGTPMQKWAESNPMLAWREYNKKFPSGIPTQGPDDARIAQAMSQGNYFAPEGGPSPIRMDPSTAFKGGFAIGSGNAAPPAQQPTQALQGMDTQQLYGAGTPNFGAFKLPGGAMSQGANVSAPFKQASAMSAQYTNPQNFGSPEELAAPQDPGVQTRLKNFLSGLGA